MVMDTVTITDMATGTVMATAKAMVMATIDANPDDPIYNDVYAIWVNDDLYSVSPGMLEEDTSIHSLRLEVSSSGLSLFDFIFSSFSHLNLRSRDIAYFRNLLVFLIYIIYLGADCTVPYQR